MISCSRQAWFEKLSFIVFLLITSQIVDISGSKAFARRQSDDCLSIESLDSNLIMLSQVPNPITPRPPEQPTPTLPPVREVPLKPTTPTPPTTETPQNIPGTITVREFVFEGNTAFSDRELAEVVKSFVGREITFAELLQVEAAVSKKYTDAGFINSGAVIPSDQTFSREGAVVKIQIVEGGLEDIKVTGLQRLDPNYVRSRIAIATQKPLDRNRLLESLQLLQLNPLINSISAELSAGARPELSLLEVKVSEANPFSAQLFVDNGRTPSVGSFRRGIQLNHANLLGLGDGLGVGYSNTNGSNAYDLSYTLPINPQNGTLSFSYSRTTSNVTESPFDRLSITGDSNSYQLTFRQPLIQKPNQEFALGLTASRQESQTRLLGEDFPLSTGADEQGRTRISALRFFQDYVTRNPVEVFALRSQLSLGLGVLNATINSTAPDSRFFAWRGQAQYVRLLAPETLFVARTDIQLADRALVPLEQFGLGGLRSVRGYRQDAFLTDNGAFLSAEAQFPILRFPDLGGIVHIVPFLDFGTTWNSGGRSGQNVNNSAGASPSFGPLFSTGLGLQLKLGDRFTARLDYGLPLVNNDAAGKPVSTNNLFFSIEYRAF
jgi:hemolysin activation/secretion protein